MKKILYLFFYAFLFISAYANEGSVQLPIDKAPMEQKIEENIPQSETNDTVNQEDVSVSSPVVTPPSEDKEKVENKILVPSTRFNKSLNESLYAHPSFKKENSLLEKMLRKPSATQIRTPTQQRSFDRESFLSREQTKAKKALQDKEIEKIEKKMRELHNLPEGDIPAQQ